MNRNYNHPFSPENKRQRESAREDVRTAIQKLGQARGKMKSQVDKAKISHLCGELGALLQGGLW